MSPLKKSFVCHHFVSQPTKPGVKTFIEKHKAQIRNYSSVIKQLNFEVQKMILVYLNDDIDICEVQ